MKCRCGGDNRSSRGKRTRNNEKIINLKWVFDSKVGRRNGRDKPRSHRKVVCSHVLLESFRSFCKFSGWKVRVKSGHWDCLSGKHRMACCPKRLVLENAFSLPKNKKRSETFSYLFFPSFRFAFHEVIYWYHHGKFPTARENLFYILLENRSNFEERKSLPGKIVFPSISFDGVFCVWVLRNFQVPVRIRLFHRVQSLAATINLGALRISLREGKKRKVWKFNSGFFRPKSAAALKTRGRGQKQ